jgi:hypothetical protein
MQRALALPNSLFKRDYSCIFYGSITFLYILIILELRKLTSSQIVKFLWGVNL